MITLEEIGQRVAQLAEYDAAIAHSSEDALHREVLEAIAAGAPNAAALAAAALKSTELDFHRWYE